MILLRFRTTMSFMSTTNTLWIESYKINSLLVNAMGHLGLYGVLNLLQETAWMHAESLGFGLKQMEKENLFWVLTRQSLSMKEWPAFGTQVQIQTWIRPPEGAFFNREFRILNQEGKEIGTCVTSWMALDKNTKKPLPTQNLRPWEQITRAETTGLTPEKIAVEGEYEKMAKFRVRNSDLDTNQHVNNTKYAQWILDSIPYDLHRQLKLNTYSVNFLAETHLGDEVQVDRNCSQANGFTEEQGLSLYRGLRVSDQKVLFTARVGWERRK
ncbi:acyl-[acyl-carrier-protein] thioesterase [Bdellovibrio sp. HCB337]|uniref:acyl-[acyl-carrier-protein] thioesterase n=1 Tax=Bdellovibrio sp. HCB337 TaxID=3394358 RepID=UPI0039A6BEEF